MYQDIDRREVQDLAALGPREMCGKLEEEPSKELFVALLRRFGTALLEGNDEMITQMVRGLRRLDRDSIDPTMELVAESLLDVLDFSRSHWLRTRPKNLEGISLSPGERDILEYLANHPQTHPRAIASDLDRPEQSVSRSLSKYRDCDRPLVTYRESGQRHEYFLTDVGRRIVYQESEPDWVGEAASLVSEAWNAYEEYLSMEERTADPSEHLESWVTKVVRRAVERPDPSHRSFVIRLRRILRKQKVNSLAPRVQGSQEPPEYGQSESGDVYFQMSNSESQAALGQ